LTITTSIDALRAAIPGGVILPADTTYDEARTSFNGTIDRRPALIVRPRSTAEVAEAVRWARASELPIAVRGGGHSVAGHSLADDAFVIDLRLMRDVSLDLDRGVAHVPGGALWEDVDRATTAHGMAVPGGTFADTGVGGLTLGGGLGFILGTAGLTCDNLIEAEVVTADGSVVRAALDEDADLLWALRGGGGNFGVVTDFVLRMHPVAALQVARLTCGLDRVADVLSAVAEFARFAPRELSLFVVGPGEEQGDPDAPPPPPFMRVAATYQGSKEDAEEAIAPLRSIPGLRGEFVPMTYLELQAMSGILPFGLRHYWKGHFVRDLTPDVAAAIAAAMTDLPGPHAFMLIEALTGAARDEPEGGAAFGQRAARWNVTALAVWEDPAQDETHIAWARRTAEAARPASLSGAGYSNYASPDETPERVAAAYGPERFARLRAIKARLDPENVFRFNNNIPPA
jgi:FAD/FMN-containing dehydrogenase